MQAVAAELAYLYLERLSNSAFSELTSVIC